MADVADAGRAGQLCLLPQHRRFAGGMASSRSVGAVAAAAPAEIRGSAFGLLATVQAVGNVAASAIAGLLYTLASPAVAFGYLVAWIVAALGVLGWAIYH